MSHMQWADKDKLLNELRTVITDTEELLRMTEDQVGDAANGIRERMTLRLNQATKELHHLQHMAVEKAKEARHATDEYVNENPWKSVGIATGVGLIVGLLLSRR
jgi:ElaB/YqjD/DUF883 family membrane-anchored ribosome-binding protein